MACNVCYNVFKRRELNVCPLPKCDYTMCNECVRLYTYQYRQYTCPACQRSRFWSPQKQFIAYILIFILWWVYSKD